MENPIIEAKKEIIEWVKNLDELETIQELLDLKNNNNSSFQVNEPELEYAVKDDFDERFSKGMSSENARIESKKRVREWWGK
ncbi:hypothetical protein [Halpernia frigidisoli]|uniref:Addiction module component n=1 Tax=Halpernia frigidisoli TaxID=1125876 RepID=A0A1I3F4N0_9FLAO|nr:hypothetical protein [Halpernia frigidisoli]SFI06167.1 hypothetical protein SAMN05443292_1154 [Halpernia frigidisoli]